MQRQIGDFIEKQRATVGCLKQALFVLVSTGKTALEMPEKLALDQLFRNRTTVYGDKGRVAPELCL